MSFFLTTAAASFRRGGGEPEPVVYDPDYQAVLDYATANSIPLPTNNQQAIDNEIMLGLKASGAWSKTDSFLQLKGDSVPGFKLICWKRLIQTIGYGSLTWSSSGVKGNAVNAYIDLLFVPETDAVNYQERNASIGITIGDTIKNNDLIGSYSGSNNGYVLWRPNNSVHCLNRLDTSSNFDGVGKIGFNSMSRDGNNLTIKGDGEATANTGNFTGMPEYSLFLFARNNRGKVDFFGDNTISNVIIGGNMSEEHDALTNILE